MGRASLPAAYAGRMTARYRNEPIYTAAIGAGRLMFGALRVKRDVRGAENLPDDGGAVIAITHFGSGICS